MFEILLGGCLTVKN